MKKILLLFLVLAMLLGMMPVTALTVEGSNGGDSYRWEMENNRMVSVATDGNTVNAATLDSGSVGDGTFYKARYTLETEVRLCHDAPWVVEWRSVGNWSGMLLSSVSQSPSDGLIYLFRDPGSKMVAFGEYTGSWNNYGLILDCDMSVPHVFRLENRISPDGTNTVYLLVDGEEIDALHHYYIAGKYQNKTVNWANGRDLVFRNLGTTSHPMGGMKLDYLQIWENGHDHAYRSDVTAPTCTKEGYTTYTCACGDSYMADPVDALGHRYENNICTICGHENANPYQGKTIACIGDSITYGVGVTRDQNDYVTVLAKALEMDYIRLGVSGTTLCTGGHATCNFGKLTEENLAGADVVTVLLGINDFVQARKGYYTLGTIDSEDTSTIYGAAHMWCQKIQELRQTDSLRDTEFYFMTPVITSWNNSVSSVRNWDQSKTNLHGYTLRDLCNAIIEVCDLYEIPVMDLNLVSGLYYNSASDHNTDQFGGDGAHPGETGHRMMADAIRNILLKKNLREDHDHHYGSWVTTDYPDCVGGEQQRVCTICTATERTALEGKGHTYENGTCLACGEVDPDYVPAPVLPTLTAKYPTVSFEDVIVLNVYFAAENTENVTEMGLMTFREMVENADISLAEEVLPGYSWNESAKLYTASTKGIAAKELGKTINFAVYAKLADGTYAYSKVSSYSVETYAKKQLEEGSDAMKALMVATLNYAAAAQTHFSYNADALVNATLTAEDHALNVAYSEDMINLPQKPDAAKLGEMADNGGYTKRYATVSFEGAFSINYYFAPSATPVGDVTMYVWTQDDYNAVESLSKDNASYAVTMELLASGEYQGVIENIAAKQLNDAVYVSFCYSDGTNAYCSGINGYSIGQYCKAQAVHTGTMAELAKATAVYGYYAKQRFG